MIQEGNFRVSGSPIYLFVQSGTEYDQLDGPQRCGGKIHAIYQEFTEHDITKTDHLVREKELASMIKKEVDLLPKASS